MHTAPERFVKELPSRGVRRALSRLEVMRSRREAGELCRVLVDAQGRLSLVVTEEYSWSDGEACEAEGGRASR